MESGQGVGTWESRNSSFLVLLESGLGVRGLLSQSQDLESAPGVSSEELVSELGVRKRSRVLGVQKF